MERINLFDTATINLALAIDIDTCLNGFSLKYEIKLKNLANGSSLFLN